MKKNTSTTNTGLIRGSGLGPIKTTVIPKGTLPNPTRPADTFRKATFPKRAGNK